jgi:uncharacterized integral membrane protein
MTFLREYWLWIVIPFGIVIGLILLFLIWTNNDAVSEFQYSVF